MAPRRTFGWAIVEKMEPSNDPIEASALSRDLAKRFHRFFAGAPRYREGAIRNTTIGGMIVGMRSKTSVTLSQEALQAIDRLAAEGSNRSQVIERAVLEFVERREREIREARDLETLNRASDELNREMADVLSYQVDL